MSHKLSNIAFLLHVHQGWQYCFFFLYESPSLAILPFFCMERQGWQYCPSSVCNTAWQYCPSSVCTAMIGHLVFLLYVPPILSFFSMYLRADHIAFLLYVPTSLSILSFFSMYHQACLYCVSSICLTKLY